MGRTVDDIMRLSIEQRKENYFVKDIGTVSISNHGTTVVLRDYSAYSFVWQKTYVKSPSRSIDGAISNINDISTFITGHFKLDFSLMSIDDYRELMKLIYSGDNEFTVTCYDVVYDRPVTLKMYFSTEEMPKLWTIVNKMQKDKDEWEEWVDLVGVNGYTVEMIGTNTDNEDFKDYFKQSV